MLGGRFGVWSVLHLPGMDRVKGPGPSCETLDCKTRSHRRAGIKVWEESLLLSQK